MDANPQRFGKRYRILGEIGRGGMGNLFKTYDEVRAREMALKELAPDFANSPSAVLRFKNEFRVMSEFRHPNMVGVYDFGTNSDGVPFFTMELVGGLTLSAVPDPSPDLAADVLVQLCQVLSHIHSRLYAHMDLKPDNIKVLDDGAIRLLDYGLMTQLGVQAPGKISGTYYYMAPETIVGGIIDESTDLYSAGVIGYELLTGRRPFVGDRRAILRGHLKTTPPRPSEIRPGVPESMDRIVMRLLAKEKDERYRDCAETLEDLSLPTGRAARVETSEMKQGYLYSNKLVGRKRETDRFRRALERLENGRGSSLFFGAPAGMGKTRLLNELKTHAELEGIPTVFLDAQSAENRTCGWLKALFERLLPLSEPEETQRFGPALKRLETDGDPGEEAAAETGPSTPDLSAVLAAWTASVTRRTPLALLVDDMHWTDWNSVHALNDLIRNLGHTSLIVAAAFRSDEAEKTSPLWHTVEEESSEYLELSPLDEELTRDLVRRLLYPSKVSEDFCDYCYRNSGGNVFDLIEFLRFLIADGRLTREGNRWVEPVDPDTAALPEKLRDRLAARTAGLRSEALKLAEIASVFEADLDPEDWRRISDLDERLFFSGIDSLVESQIVFRLDGRYRFCHDKIRVALYECLDEEIRAEYHRKAGRRLEERTGGRQRESIPTIARHYVEARHGEKAAEYSLKAAQAAERDLADWEAFVHYRNAADFLEKMPDYPDRDEILLEIHERASQFSSAAWIDAATCLAWLEKAIGHYRHEGDLEKVFGLSLSYVVTSCITGDYHAARRKIPEIVSVCDVREGSLPWAILYGAGVCLADWYQGFQRDCFRHAVSATEIFEGMLDDLPDEAWPAYSWALFWRDKARAYLGLPVDMANVEKIGRLASEGKSDKTIYWHTLTAVTARAAFTGRWSDLGAWMRRASRLSREMGKIYWFECWISHSYLFGAIQHGRFSQLETHIERVAASPDPYQARLSHLFSGMLALERKNPDAAERHLEEFVRLEETGGPDNSYLEGFLHWALACLEKGEGDRAGRLLDKGAALAEAGKRENPLYRLRYREAQARLALAERDLDRASALLDESETIAKETDNPIQKGFVLKTRANLLAARGMEKRARDCLAEASEIFLSIDNKYQAGKVSVLLDALDEGRKGATAEKRDDGDQPDTVVEKDAATVVEDDSPASEWKAGKEGKDSLERTGIDDRDEDLGKTKAE